MYTAYTYVQIYVISFAKTCHFHTLWQGTVFIVNKYIAPSINQLLTSTALPKVDRSVFLRVVSEICQMFMSAQVSTECHLLAYTGSHLAGNHHPTG